MAILLALVTAAMFGVGDFCGGLASRRALVVQVVAGSHAFGAVGAVAASILVAETFTWRDAFLGSTGGIFGVIGVFFLYRRLAVGPMSVVAPMTAITSAVVPTIWGVLDGERLSALAWLGALIGLAAVGLVSTTGDRNGDDRAPVTAQVVAESLLAGIGFGAMFIFLDATEEATAPWPVASARILTTTVLAVVVLGTAVRAGRPAIPRDGTALALIAAVGLLDTASNITFLYATNAGQLAVVSVLTALYPISTVILAWLVLKERMTIVQGIGFVAAMVATELLVIG